MSIRLRDRREGGRLLAAMLGDYAGQERVQVLALPRGGVPVGFEIAQALGAPLDVFLVRKLGVPGHEELAMGAVATGGVRVLNDEVLQALNIPQDVIELVTHNELRELERRERAYRGSQPPLEVRGRSIILVDDGLATGSTMRAAVAALKQQGPAELIIAVPTAAPSVCEQFKAEVQRVVCGMTPEPFYAVGLWYEDFSQTSDEEVRILLERAQQPLRSREHGDGA